jgi:hypothetical protein
VRLCTRMRVVHLVRQERCQRKRLKVAIERIRGLCILEQAALPSGDRVVGMQLERAEPHELLVLSESSAIPARPSPSLMREGIWSST